MLILTCPESLYASESTCRGSPNKATLVAIDLPGFGGSERRESSSRPRRWARS
jgi:pimeloyl-ACP methyl ester carboxylesterase